MQGNLQVWRHIIGSRQEDELMLAEGLQECHVSLTKTKDGSFVIISSNSKTSSEVNDLQLACPRTLSSILIWQPCLSHPVNCWGGRRGATWLLTGIDMEWDKGGIP